MLSAKLHLQFSAGSTQQPGYYPVARTVCEKKSV
jgi:hypothetical protein